MNKTLVRTYRKAGVSMVWETSPGDCEACKGQHGQPVHNITPPLHNGCTCTVKPDL